MGFNGLHSRCHPDIAAMSNSQFYGGQLLDGCTALQRAPLAPGLPPLVCVDVRGTHQYSGVSHSTSNGAEARAVVQVRKLPSQQLRVFAAVHAHLSLLSMNTVFAQ
jgi:superfamily I DNA and/or RNA helicase